MSYVIPLLKLPLDAQVCLLHMLSVPDVMCQQGVLQVAAALAARHIGGAVNYVGVAETLSMSSAAQVRLVFHESPIGTWSALPSNHRSALRRPCVGGAHLSSPWLTML